MNVEINLNEGQLKEIVSEAILRAIDEKQRETLIAQAIAHLLAEEKTGYSRDQSPIKRAFNQAAYEVAIQSARSALAGDPAVKEKIVGLIAEASERVFETNRERTVERMAQAIAEGLSD